MTLRIWNGKSIGFACRSLGNNKWCGHRCRSIHWKRTSVNTIHFFVTLYFTQKNLPSFSQVGQPRMNCENTLSFALTYENDTQQNTNLPFATISLDSQQSDNLIACISQAQIYCNLNIGFRRHSHSIPHKKTLILKISYTPDGLNQIITSVYSLTCFSSQ